MIKTYTNYIVNNNISPAKRIEPAPRTCQSIAITTIRHRFTVLKDSPAFTHSARAKTSISRNNWGSRSCHSGIITYSYRTFGTASFVQKAEGRLTHSPCKYLPQVNTYRHKGINYNTVYKNLEIFDRILAKFYRSCRKNL